MKIPDKIKIGGHEYTTDIRSNLRDEDGSSLMGIHRGSDEYIGINNGYPEGSQNSSLLHEIIEAINWANELGLEHKQICTLETGLYQVLHDNRLHFDE